jgi:hypothetical protein
VRLKHSLLDTNVLLNRIAKQIYDHGYDESLLDVTFRPYLGSRNYSDIRNAETSFLSTSGEIGGSVNGEIKLTADDSPYLVVVDYGFFSSCRPANRPDRKKKNNDNIS